MGVLSATVSVHHVCASCLQRPEGCIGSSETGVTDGCELPCVCWELNLDALEEQPVLLVTETPLQSCVYIF